MRADLLVTNADVLTLDPDRPRASAVACSQGRIVAIGGREVERMAQPGVQVLDAGGATVVPGFVDAHVHLVATGLSAEAIHVHGVPTLEAILETIRRGSAGVGEGWIMVDGFDDTMVAERRYPTAEELEAAGGGRPVMVVRLDGHSCAVSTTGLRLLRLGEGTGGIEIDREGTPTGVLRGAANSLAQRTVGAEVPPIERRRAFLRAANEALRRGITTVHDIEEVGTDATIVLAALSETPLKVHLYAIAQDVGLVPKGCTGLKVFVDGSMDSHTGLLWEQYADRPGVYGEFYNPPERLDALAKAGVDGGLQVMAHAIGDRAIGEILEIYSRCPPAGLPHRIEHYELPRPEDNRRCLELGVVVSTQPAFVHLWDYAGFYEARLGPGRARGIHPYRALCSLGVLLCGGSDSPVTPLDPLLGIHGAVNHPLEEQGLSPHEALKMFTVNGALAVGEGEGKGPLAPGKAADMALLEANPLEVPPSKLKEIGVRATIVGGRLAYKG